VDNGVCPEGRDERALSPHTAMVVLVTPERPVPNGRRLYLWP